MPTPKSKKHIQTVEVRHGDIIYTVNIYKSRRKMTTYTITISHDKLSPSGSYKSKVSKGPFDSVEDAIEKAYSIIINKDAT